MLENKLSNPQKHSLQEIKFLGATHLFKLPWWKPSITHSSKISESFVPNFNLYCLDISILWFLLPTQCNLLSNFWETRAFKELFEDRKETATVEKSLNINALMGNYSFSVLERSISKWLKTWTVTHVKVSVCKNEAYGFLSWMTIMFSLNT